MKTNITAIERDGFNIRTLSISLDILDPAINTEDKIRNAVMAACDEYIATEDGRKTYSYNCESFNWADFASNVPNSICEKHGFRQINSDISDIEVDWDEQLVTENPEDD